jgi:hypothetical protein
MPVRSRLSRLFPLAFLGLAAPAASAQVTAYLESGFGLALTVTTSYLHSENTFPNGDISSDRREISVRLIPRDLIEGLIEDGVIPAPLAGWRIVARAQGPDAEQLRYTYFAVKKGQPEIALEGENAPFSMGEIAVRVLSYKLRSDSASVILSGSGRSQIAFQTTFQVVDGNFQISGLATVPFSYKKVPKGMLGPVAFAPGKVAARVLGGGSGSDPDIGEFVFTVHGSIAFSEHRILSTQSTAPDADPGLGSIWFDIGSTPLPTDFTPISGPAPWALSSK